MSSNVKNITVLLSMLHQVQTWYTMRTDACRKRIMCAIMCATVFHQQIEKGNIANQIHGLPVDYGKYILIADSKQ